MSPQTEFIVGRHIGQSWNPNVSFRNAETEAQEWEMGEKTPWL